MPRDNRNFAEKMREIKEKIANSILRRAANRPAKESDEKKEPSYSFDYPHFDYNKLGEEKKEIEKKLEKMKKEEEKQEKKEEELEKKIEEEKKEEEKLEKKEEKIKEESEKHEEKREPRDEHREEEPLNPFYGPITAMKRYTRHPITMLSLAFSNIAEVVIEIILILMWGFLVLGIPSVRSTVLTPFGVIFFIILTIIYGIEFFSVIGKFSVPNFSYALSALLAAPIAAMQTYAVFGIIGLPWNGFWIVINIIITIIALIFFNDLYMAGGSWAFIGVSIFLIVGMYFALGPYAAYTEKYTEILKDSMSSGIDILSEKISDMALLLTNPVAYQAKMAQRNVMSDQEVDKPKGVEISDIIPLMNPVPNGSEVYVQVILKNEGVSTAKNVKLNVRCKKCVATKGSMPIHFDVDDEMISHESKFISFSVVASSKRVPDNMYLYYDVIYEFSSNSSIQAEIMDENDINEMVLSGRNVFHDVVASGTPGPAMISLNLGKQPLIAGQERALLISMVDTRRDGEIILPEDSEITVKIPNDIIEGPVACNGGSIWDVEDKNVISGYYTLVIKPKKRLSFKKIKTAGIYCKFVPKIPESHGGKPISISDFIFATINKYLYNVSSKQSIGITFTLGENMTGTKKVNKTYADYSNYIGSCDFETPIHENPYLDGKYWFGCRIHPQTGDCKFHTGLDLDSQNDKATIFAAEEGTVVFAGFNGGYGNMIEIDHNCGKYKIKTIYGHLSSISVRKGQHVNKGEPIGIMGSTGSSTEPHLHFEVWVLDGGSWKLLSPYHVLSDRSRIKIDPPGAIYNDCDCTVPTNVVYPK